MESKKYVSRARAMVKRLLPNWLLPYARRVDKHIYEKRTRNAFYRNDYERLTALKCLISYNKYGGYCVPLASRHRLAATAVLANDVYEPNTIEFMREHCGLGDIVHAGAYFGDFLPALSSTLSEGSYIWSFEPNAENFKCAQITCIINGLQNVRLLNAGLGAEDTVAPIEVADHTGLAHGGASTFLTSQELSGSSSRRVQAAELVRLDDVIERERHVSILQLDVEGYEEFAIKGALETIRRCYPILILEILPGSRLLDGEWFQQSIMSLGYRQTGSLHENIVLARNGSVNDGPKRL